MKKLPLTLLVSLSLLGSLFAQNRPNILWITSEDNASHWMGCYGNTDARTPRIDALAEKGHLFSAAFSNAPVCAVARSTILTGVYAPTQGTQHMRSRHRIPKNFRPHTSYLQELGYYCTNASKTDYNFEGNDKAVWDECSPKAHYKNRAEGQPFFSIFNLTVSHESSLFPQKVKANRANGIIPETTRLDPANIAVPPCLPDLPEIRSDFAIYHDVLTALDTQVGQILDELAAAGLAENTIVFYYGDHGGPTPRGKRYIEDTGVRIPMIVHVPEKWRAYTPFKTGEKVSEPVAFIDLAPTLLSLAGLDKPQHMQGRAFLGPKRMTPPQNDVVFLHADRFDELYGMRRGITDGRWKYMRRFTPYLAAAPYSYYQFSMPGWAAMEAAWKNGQLSGYHKALWETPQAVDYLFDTQADPWEVHNLADAPAHAERLALMSARLKAKMSEIKDTGIIPEPMFADLAGKSTIYDFARSPNFDYPKTIDLAWIATNKDTQEIPSLLDALDSKDPVQRYWGAQGLLILGDQAKAQIPALEKVMKEDSNAANRITAAHALYLLGKEELAAAQLVSELEKSANDYVVQLVINTLTRIEATGAVPSAWIEATLNRKQSNEYLNRFAKRLKAGRED
ncbi:MAG: sulfatase-like hydrolase/transferase [Verrucomicrobiae bacterium]|nr:sulfatase-like hydrolase/transferase [Verrucomicrobiae bacterium]